jgi:hypothetical protein
MTDERSRPGYMKTEVKVARKWHFDSYVPKIAATFTFTSNLLQESSVSASGHVAGSLLSHTCHAESGLIRKGG